jgi:hypothetical protein
VQAPSARSHCLGRWWNRSPDLPGITRSGPWNQGCHEVWGPKLGDVAQKLPSGYLT